MASDAAEKRLPVDIDQGMREGPGKRRMWIRERRQIHKTRIKCTEEPTKSYSTKLKQVFPRLLETCTLVSF